MSLGNLRTAVKCFSIFFLLIFFFNNNNKKNRLGFIKNIMCSQDSLISTDSIQSIYENEKRKKEKERKAALILVRKFNGRGVVHMFLEGCVITEWRSDHVI